MLKIARRQQFLRAASTIWAEPQVMKLHEHNQRKCEHPALLGKAAAATEPLHPNPAIAAVMADMPRKAAERQAWLEVNMPPEPACPYGLDLQRLVWNYLNDKSCFQPLPNTTWRNYAAEAASHYASLGLSHLNNLAEGGDSSAPERLAELAIQFVECVNRLALSESHRAKLIPFARRCLAWPTLTARRKIFSTDHDELIRKLEVGKDTVFGSDSQARFNPSRRFAKLTMELIERIEDARTTSAYFFTQPSSWVLEARKLPRFSKESKLQWWSVLEQLLDEECSTLRRAEVYYRLVTAPSHQHRRAAMLRSKIRDEFATLCGIHRKKSGCLPKLKRQFGNRLRSPHKVS